VRNPYVQQGPVVGNLVAEAIHEATANGRNQLLYFGGPDA
jgi:hypothetical protein